MKDNQELITKIQNFDLNANNENPNYHVHGLHKYPARMHPYVAKIIIEQLANRNSIIYEPYCGSGTVLIESMLNGNESIGIDTNPLAVLMAKVKTTPISSSKLKQAYQIIEHDLFKFKHQTFLRELPFNINDTNLNYWFKENTIRKLSVINHLLNYEWLDFSKDVYNFARLNFARLVREVSHVRHNEFKLYRKPEYLLEFRTKPVFKTYLQIFKDNMKRMNEFYNIVKERGVRHYSPSIYNKNNNSFILKRRASLVVTSPPYGDNNTTVSYGQFSRYSLLWLGFPKKLVYSLDHSIKNNDTDEEYDILKNSSTFKRTLKKIAHRDEKRANVVEEYFISMTRSLHQISKSIRKGGSLCMIIGPRTVRNIVVPNPRILSQIASQLGLEEVFKLTRNISFKTLPHRNAEGNTILNEKIMFFHKN